MSGNPQSVSDTARLNTIESAIADIKAGKVVIVVDDEDRENEGDFICAAACITPEIINFMATHGRGLICSPIDEIRADELGLDLMVSSNTALHETAFTVSIDLIGKGCTTGISAYDRSTGIKALVDPNTRPEDFARPGHIFPLRAKSGGVLRRTGHTEAAIDLARLAGFFPAGVLVEILNEDGTMARLPQLLEIAARFDLKIISIKDLVAYRMRHERIIKREDAATVITRYGDFEVIAFRQLTSGDIHIALKKGHWQPDEPVLVRVHSSSATGDILGSLVEGYGEQLNKVMELIAEEGKGIIICMRHSEKSESILTRIQQYKLQFETGQAALMEKKQEMEQRDFGVGAQILRELGATKLRLISNNPRKRVGLIGYGLEIVEDIEMN